MYFLTYEYVKEYASKNFGTDGSKGLLGTIFAGGMAGIANWSIGMPADVLKSRLQTGCIPLHRTSKLIFAKFIFFFNRSTGRYIQKWYT